MGQEERGGYHGRGCRGGDGRRRVVGDVEDLGIWRYQEG